MDSPELPPELLAGLPPVVVQFIRALLAENAALKARVAELEARLGQNSSNSSRPPSSDPPAVKRAPPKPATARRPAVSPATRSTSGPVDRPDHVRDCRPAACRRCARPLAGDDPDPLRHQVTELPPVRPVVTEYRRHRLTCPGCGATTCGDLPAGVAGQDGPRLRAACAS